MSMNNSDNNSGISESQEYRFVDDINISQTALPTETSNEIQNRPEYRANQIETMVVRADDEVDKVVSVFDVAQYVLSKLEEPCTTMKLHKLLYYCQAWYLVWEDKPLYKENIEAWANGPVIRELFNFHQGLYWITLNHLTLGNPSKLSVNQKEDIDSVISFYGNKTSQWLIDQTHIESPWRNARKGMLPNERGSRIIPLESMSEYYSSLK